MWKLSPQTRRVPPVRAGDERSIYQLPYFVESVQHMMATEVGVYSTVLSYHTE